MSFYKEHDNRLFRNVCVCITETNPLTLVSIYNLSYPEKNCVEQQ